VARSIGTVSMPTFNSASGSRPHALLGLSPSRRATSKRLARRGIGDAAHAQQQLSAKRGFAFDSGDSFGNDIGEYAAHCSAASPIRKWATACNPIVADVWLGAMRVFFLHG
jgi:hypothetical protein